MVPLTIADEIPYTDLDRGEGGLQPQAQELLVITSQSEWQAFLQRVQPGPIPEGLLRKPSSPAEEGLDLDWRREIVVAVTAKPGEKISITNAYREGTLVRVTVEQASGGPYHLVRITRERLPRGLVTVLFVDTAGQLLGEIQVTL
jgi:hypothetical protein